MEAKSETNKPISNFLFILWAGGTALLSYSLVYALRKPFTAATFDGMDFFGMDYKVATTIMQIFGYLISKFFAIKIVSELKRENRLKFMIFSVALAELALVFFGLLPTPFNVFALFFNGLALGCMWGVIFSFIEGRKVTDILASLLGVSMAVSSGMAKSLGLFVVNTFGVTEFWMPALIGGLAFPLLVLMGWSLNKLPSPTDEDRALRSERVALNGEQRRQLFKSYMPLLIMLFFANLFVTVLQDIKEDFLVKILDVDAAGLSSWAFAKVDATVTLIILCMFGLMSAVRSNIKVLCMLLGLVTCGTATLSFLAFNYSALQLQPMTWLFLQSLSLYTVYLSFQTLFFERFIACFKIKGNVGFFIITLDFIGYTGTVVVLIFKEFFNPAVNWLDFYNLMSGYVGIACSVAFIGSAVYLIQRYRREKYAEVSGEELDTPHPAGGLSGKRVALELLPDMAK
jgi:MFS family permease